MIVGQRNFMKSVMLKEYGVLMHSQGKLYQKVRIHGVFMEVMLSIILKSYGVPMQLLWSLWRVHGIHDVNHNVK